MTTLNTIIEEENTPDTEWEKEEWGAWKFVSEMLDNPDEHGIYPTSKCYKQIYDFVVAQKEKAISSRDTYWKERVRDVKFDIEALRGSPRDTDIEYARAITDVHKILDDIIDNLK